MSRANSQSSDLAKKSIQKPRQKWAVEGNLLSLFAYAQQLFQTSDTATILEILTWNPCGHVMVLCGFWYMAWSSAWGNKGTKEKTQLAILKQQQVENWQLNIFSIKYMQVHYYFCHRKKSECFVSSLSELFCFDFTMLLHLVWLPAFYKNLNQKESKLCCWQK